MMRHAGSEDSRARLAELLRQFASGRLTNDQFEDGYCALPRDRAAAKVFWFAWGHYDDLYEHRLLGRHRLSPAQRRVFARCVLFLRSGLPYEWKRRDVHVWRAQAEGDEDGSAARSPWWKPAPEVIRFFMPWVVHRWASGERAFDAKRQGRVIVDDRIWPFRRMSDYKEALASPRLLAGRGCS